MDLDFSIKAGGEGEPKLFALCLPCGSAFYLLEDALVQVPLDREGTPMFEEREGEGRFFGGGEVDFFNAFEDAADRVKVEAIRDCLRVVEEVAAPA